MTAKTFQFSAVVIYEITVEDATSLLVENDGGKRTGEWLHTHCPILEDSSYNATNLRMALGVHLAKTRVEEARQLTMSCDPQAADSNN
jgi:hypothetical protein